MLDRGRHWSLKVLAHNQNFLGLADEFSSFENASSVILPVPGEWTTSYIKGTARGPQAIINASHQVELYDEELDSEPFRSGIATLPAMDIERLTHRDALANTGLLAQRILEQKKFLITLGGEHSVSIPLVQAAKRVHDTVTVLQLDAHSDLRQVYENSSLNHACVMARVEECCPYVGAGIRSGIQGEREKLGKQSRLFYAHEMRPDSGWQDEALRHLSDTVYITFDLDFFDPSIMPAVGTPEPGGFLWGETLAFLREVFTRKNVIGCDVVELCPAAGLHHADFLAAKLVYKMIGYSQEDA